MSTPDQTMRERVAVAMFARRDDPYDDREWAELDRADQEFWYCYADAALTALATPTPAMVEAGAEAIFDEERNASMGGMPWPDWDDSEDVGKEQYRVLAHAALTAAFKEGEA